MLAVLKVLTKVNTLIKRLCGYYSKEDTPVPIPNTEVKLLSADGTWRATSWESRTQPNLVHAEVAELADAQDLKSCETYTFVPVRFRSSAPN